MSDEIKGLFTVRKTEAGLAVELDTGFSDALMLVAGSGPRILHKLENSQKAAIATYEARHKQWIKEEVSDE